MVACKKEKPLNLDITKSNLNTHGSDLDKWLKDTFLDPYNIAVIYRFDRFYTTLDKDVAPVKEEKVRIVAEGLKSVFIDCYIDVAGKSFFKPIVPKQFTMFGSAEYMDEQIRLGTAEAGRQINLLDLNGYDKSKPETFIRVFHTIHHEFGHILHQNIPIPPLYEGISNNYVGSNWVGSANTEDVAKSLGFITRYSRMNKDEDFVETISTLLVEGQDFYDAHVNTASPEAASKLRKKEQMVVDFYKNSFGIDFRALQVRIRAAIDLYGPASIRTAVTNFRGGSYTGFTIDKSNASQSPALIAAFDASLKAATVGKFSSPIKSNFELVFTDLTKNRTDMILKFNDGAFNYWFNLSATVTGNNIKFSRTTQGTGNLYGNGTLIEVPIKPLLDYFTTKTFEMSWIENTIPNSKNVLLGFVDPSSKQLEFYGTIYK